MRQPRHGIRAVGTALIQAPSGVWHGHEQSRSSGLALGLSRREKVPVHSVCIVGRVSS